MHSIVYKYINYTYHCLLYVHIHILIINTTIYAYIHYYYNSEANLSSIKWLTRQLFTAEHSNCNEREHWSIYKQYIYFLFSFRTIIDLLIIIPYYISISVDTSTHDGAVSHQSALRVFRVFRVFRIFSIFTRSKRYSDISTVIMITFKQSFMALFELFIVIILLILFFGTIFYPLERGEFIVSFMCVFTVWCTRLSVYVYIRYTIVIHPIIYVYNYARICILTCAHTYVHNPVPSMHINLPTLYHIYIYTCVCMQVNSTYPQGAFCNSVYGSGQVASSFRSVHICYTIAATTYACMIVCLGIFT